MSSLSPSAELVLVDPRDLNRTCLRQALAELLQDFLVADVRRIEDIHTSDCSQCVAIISLPGQAQPAMLHGALAAVPGGAVARRLIVLAEHAGEALVSTAIEGGASAYLTTDTTPQLLAATVRIVLLGGTCFPPSRGRKPAPPGTPRGDGAESRLTQREQDVLRLLGEGAPNKTIAFRLNMSENTVKVHLHRIMQKCHLHNRTELALMTRSYFTAPQLPHTPPLRQILGFSQPGKIADEIRAR
jgi:DNA-binding NarL/FixJ family response regulator